MHSQPYWNNYFNSGRFFISGCDVMFSLKCILNHYWNNYFNSGRYFISGCDVKLSLTFILNHYWNNYFNSGRYFNSGCNNAHYRNVRVTCIWVIEVVNFLNIVYIDLVRRPSKIQRDWNCIKWIESLVMLWIKLNCIFTYYVYIL